MRHGETDWNQRGLIQGSNDVPLNQNGFSQAFVVARILKDFPITRIISSPQSRAKHTAEIICQYFSPDILCIEPDLRERHFGNYEGRPAYGLPKIPVRPDQPNGPYDYPEGDVEPFHALRHRSKAAIDRWIGTSGNDNGLVLFVAHAGIFSALHHEMECGVYHKIENATPYEFSRKSPNGPWVCKAL
jgi:broad specificity phosphatase PhoE